MIIIYILPNISRSKSNQIMTFGRLIEYIMRIFLFQKSWQKESGRLVPDPFFILLKSRT